MSPAPLKVLGSGTYSVHGVKHGYLCLVTLLHKLRLLPPIEMIFHVSHSQSFDLRIGWLRPLSMTATLTTLHWPLLNLPAGGGHMEKWTHSATPAEPTQVL